MNAIAAAPAAELRAVGETLSSTAAYPSTALVSKLADDFFRQPQLDAVAVVDDGRPAGLITRQKFLFTVFRRFGWEVFNRKTIAELTDREALVIPDDTPVDQALALAVGRRAEDVYDELVVVDGGGRFRGLLSVRQLIVQHSHALANVLMQKDLADARARELEKVSEIKAQFLANVTHELRSPVNAIIELTELVRIAADHGYVAQIHDRLGLLLSSATNLRAIVTNILDLSKMEAGKMQVLDEEFDVVPLLHEVAETTRILAGQKPVEVVLAAEPRRVAVTDPVKLRQIVLNLTSNAAKFTDAGRVTVTQTYDRGELVIAVADTGIGIRAEDRDRLFTAFTQLEDARSKRHDGTGLGLAITRELLHLLGGTIALESAPGRGTTFTIRIADRKEIDDGTETPAAHR